MGRRWGVEGSWGSGTAKKANYAFMPEPEGAGKGTARAPAPGIRGICPARCRKAGPPSHGPMGRRNQHAGLSYLGPEFGMPHVANG